MRALSVTLLAAAAAMAAGQPAVTLVPSGKPTLGAVKPTVKFVNPPANVSLNSRDVPIQIGFSGVEDGEAVRESGSSRFWLGREARDGGGCPVGSVAPTIEKGRAWPPC